MQGESSQCRKCFESGHWASSCPNEEKCLECRQPGHRRGDPVCPKILSIFGDPLNSDAENISTVAADEKQGKEKIIFQGLMEMPRFVLKLVMQLMMLRHQIVIAQTFLLQDR